MVSNSTWPPGPNMSSSAGRTPHLAITACTWALAEVRSATNLARYAERVIMPSFS